MATAFQWEKERRPEVLELFRESVYGRRPVERPESLRFETRIENPQAMGGTAVCKQVDILFSGPEGSGKIGLVLFAPRKQSGPVPVFLLICNRPRNQMDPDRRERMPFWPAEEIVARGYAAAAFHVSDADPDQDDGFKNGVHGIFDAKAEERPANAWATVSAWAWAASRVMDYFETDPMIDVKRAAVVGHSRGGKAALWCGAEDSRFALVIGNNAGCAGASLARNKKGESIAQINKAFPHWFCRNYHAYAEREDELPVDQHLLMALIAPRLAYVASASEDAWADPEGEFLSCKLAEPVFALFGKKGLGDAPMPEAGGFLHAGTIGYHLRRGRHNLTAEDWGRFMDFADRHWKSAGDLPEKTP